MPLKKHIPIILILISYIGYGQFSKEEISTDSSEIQIVRNSVYIVFQETYKNKDSLWYSVRFIKDSTKIKHEGWKTKNNKYLGIWKEYNINGELMYTWDHANRNCIVNEPLYPYHELLEQMKTKADSLIITTYSKEFYDNQVSFNYDCYAYDQNGYVGSWTEPLVRKPTRFLFRYSARVDSSEWYDEIIGIELDNKGKYIIINDIWNNYGFEQVQSEKKIFQINKNDAMEIAKKNGLETNDLSKISELLKWEKNNTSGFFSGEFKYYIAELVDEIKDIHENARSRIIYKFNIYSFNPWTGTFIGKKKMKKVKEWEKLSGFTSDFLPDE